MSCKKESDGEPAVALRRSSRSTRGSIKPIVDLNKHELSEQEEEGEEKKEKETKKEIKTTTKRKSIVKKKEKEISDDEDEVLVLEKSDDDDKDYEEETKHKVRRNSKQTDKKTPKAAPKQKQQTSAAKTSTKKLIKSTIEKGSNESIEKHEDNIEICYELTEEEMKEVNHAFNINCSSDGEELLESDGLKTAIRSLGFEPRADEINQLIIRFSNSSGKINRNGFHKIMAFKMGSSPGNAKDGVLNDEISKVFNLLDLDKTGLITLDNLKSISKELNEEITDEELLEMITEADIDGDFMINKQEFYNIMKKTSLY